ncbi:MAG: hypothetical protein Q9217_006758 [Psora testacea]
MVNKKLRERRQKDRTTNTTSTPSPHPPRAQAIDLPGAQDKASEGPPHSKTHTPQPPPTLPPPSSSSLSAPKRKHYTAQQIATHYNLFPSQLRILNTDPLNGHSLLSLATARQKISPDLKLAFVLLDNHAHPEWPFLILNSEDEEWGGTCLLPDARYPSRAKRVPAFVLAPCGEESSMVDVGGNDNERTGCDRYYYAGTFRIVSAIYLSNETRLARYLRSPPVEEGQKQGAHSAVAYWNCWKRVMEPPGLNGRAIIRFEEVEEVDGAGDPLDTREETGEKGKGDEMH